MNKQDIISKVKTLNLLKNSYIVFGSCPMAVLGIRESNDIDFLVSEELYKKLEKMGWIKIYKSPKDHPLTFDVFEAHNNWNFSKYKPTLEELLKNAFEVEGIPFASIKDVQKWKKASGRPKDLTDLKLIEDFLKVSV